LGVSLSYSTRILTSLVFFCFLKVQNLRDNLDEGNNAFWDFTEEGRRVERRERGTCMKV
jgi:hypothetical protein